MGSIVTSSVLLEAPGPISDHVFTLDGLVLNGVDADGVVWALDDVESWWSSAQVRTPTADRVASDGVHAGPARRGGLVITLTGNAYCPTLEARRRVTDRVRAICSDANALYELVVTDVDDTVDHCRVRLAAGPGPRAFPQSRQVVRFQVSLLVPDGLRHGPLQQESTGLPDDTGGLRFDLFTNGVASVGYLDFGALGTTGRIQLVNDGTAPAWPTLTVTGPLPGFELTEITTGQRLRYEASLGDGQYVVLDSRTGRVLLDGVADRSGSLTIRDWWSIPAQGYREVLFQSYGVVSGPGASLDVSWAAARR